VVRTVDIQALEGRIRAAGVRSLLPSQHAVSFPVSGDPQVVDALPLATGWLVVLRCGDRVLVLPLAGNGDATRARPGDGVAAAVMRFIAEGGLAGRFRGRPLGELPAGAAERIAERAIETDQSNESVVVDERAIVKLSSVPAPAPHPSVDLPEHLREVGFTETPALAGSLVWSGDDGELLLATVTELLPGALDGWDWHVEVLEGIAEGRPPAAWTRPAAALGGVVARLHAALATASSVIPTPRSLATADDVASWIKRSSATLEQAIALTDGPEGDRLRSHEPAIRRAFEASGAIAPTPLIGIHGDLHVGQLLPWRDGFAVIDFEGDPLQDVDERGAMRPAALDVASVVRSLDHVGRIVQRRRPSRAREIGSWIAGARASFLGAYTAELSALGEGNLFDERLLRPFEVAQECHEFVYAARYLPSWRYAPDLALPSLLEGA
jgi:maltokinase